MDPIPEIITSDIKFAAAALVLGFEPHPEGLILNTVSRGEEKTVFRFQDVEPLRDYFRTWRNAEKWREFADKNPDHPLVFIRAAFSSNNEGNDKVRALCATIETTESPWAYVLAAFLTRGWIRDAITQSGRIVYQQNKSNPRTWRWKVEKPR
jgi:hypothetical protein